MSFLSRIFGARDARQRLRPLYDGIVAVARDPAWYQGGGVPDTVDGRFDMVSTLTALVLLRLEGDGGAFARDSALLTELFIDDMDASLRQIGIGDFVVGKHVGRMMGALGGRLGALREAGDALETPVRRNIFHDAPPSEAAVTFVAARLARIRAALAAVPADRLLADGMPPP